MSILISPNHELDEFLNYWTFEDKIEVFRNRVQDWQLSVAKAILEAEIPHRRVI